MKSLALSSKIKITYFIFLSKYYVTAVQLRDHNKYKVIEFNRFKFEKVFKNLNSDFRMIVKHLEFVTPEIMVIRDFDKILALES